MNSIILLFVGLILVSIGGSFIYFRKKFEAKAQTTIGKIIGAKKTTSNKGQAMYKSVAEFTAPNGEKIRFSSQISSSALPRSKPIKIFFDPQNPKDARLGNHHMVMFGSTFVLFGLAALYFARLESIKEAQLAQNSPLFSFINIGIGLLVIGQIAFVFYKGYSKFKKHAKSQGMPANFQTLKSEFKKHSREEKTKEEDLSDEALVPASEFIKYNKATKTGGYIGVVIGIALIIGGGYWGKSRYEFIEAASFTSGTVTHLIREESRDSDGHTSIVYRPKVRYTHPNGNSYSFKHETASSHSSYTVGDSVDVLFASENPQNAIIDNGWMNYLGAIILLFIGSILTFFGIKASRKAPSH